MKKNIFILLTVVFINCNGQKKQAVDHHKFTNNLIKETSPYLLQHAHNPVNWYAWNDETLALAKKENKLILISIGYAACHWCHVMEHESFENEEVAKMMNTNYICIKVDREERPDIDQVYMNAVQLMTGRGGWPLNAVALPNGKPVWGGTYFRKDDWVKSLTQIADLYQKDKKKLEEYDTKLTEGIQQSGLIHINRKKENFTKKYLKECVNKWEKYFDEQFGGMKRIPKFPMPNNYHFLLRYAYQTNNKKLKNYVNITLFKMARGGLFDQVGGGFSRYSTDKKWHIPHFEKMLYDNAQLVSLFSDAYLATKNDEYKETVYQTLIFIERELMNKNGGFYSSLDADSLDKKGKLEEGTFYIWKKEDLQKLITDFNLFSEYYNINTYGLWEYGNYHLIKTSSDKFFAKEHKIDINLLKNKVKNWKNILLKAREKRSRPRLDDKILTSWNALMLKGYVDAYRTFNDHHFLEIALKNANFLEQNLLKENGSLHHNFKNNKSSINGYLEDYAALIDAYIALYEVTFNTKWLHTAKQLTDYTFDHFFDIKYHMFFFTSNTDTKLISRKMETEDNVIPASNSIMAKNLFKLSHFYNNPYYLKTSKQMLHNMKDMDTYTSAYSNWLDLYLNLTYNYYEVAVSGADALQKVKEINKEYIPNKLISGSTTKSNLPLLQERFSKSTTLIYVCVNNACQLPTNNSKEAIKQLKK